MSYLTINEAAASKGFLQDLLYFGGLVSAGDTVCNRNGGDIGLRTSGLSGAPATASFCAKLLTRDATGIDWKEADREIDLFAKLKFYPHPKVESAPSSEMISFESISQSTSDAILLCAAAIANFCKQTGLIWDDSKTSITSLISGSMFAAMLANYGCFLSQVNSGKSPASDVIPLAHLVYDPVQAQAAGATRAGTTPTAGSGSRVAQGQSAYKQSGGKSGAAIGITSAHGKVGLGYHVYCIKATNTKSKSDAYASIDPLDMRRSVIVNGTRVNGVRINSSHGQTTCRCVFKTANDAQVFLNNMLKTIKIDPSISTPIVARSKGDSNGFFEVETNCGKCYIAARKLNEDATDSSEILDEDACVSKKPKYKASTPAERQALAEEVRDHGILDFDAYNEPIVFVGN